MIRVYGEPAPQGSKRAYVRGGRAVLVESSAKVKPWRQNVVAAVLDAEPGVRHDTAVCVRVQFIMARPKHHFGSRKGQPYLLPGAPRHVEKRPDLDKMLRSTFDGLTDSGLISDDSIIAVIHAEKRYADPGEPPGAVIHVAAAGPGEGPLRGF